MRKTYIKCKNVAIKRTFSKNVAIKLTFSKNNISKNVTKNKQLF